MRRKQLVIVVAVVIVASVASAVVAYRLGARRGASGQAGFSSSGSSPGCVSVQQAGQHTGEQACVEGRVLRVFTSRGGNTFLDFCADYRHCPFTSVIFASDRQKFGDLGTLAGREIEIRGNVVPYNGHAEIVIHDSSQIRSAR